jgi:transcriptional regulator with XRE-family HTH domain
LARPDPLDLLGTRQRLAAELLRLRLDAGLSTHQLAERIGASQSKVSKIERARVAVAVPDVRAWAKATGLSNARVDQLVAVAERALTDTLTRRTILRHGIPANQQRLGDIERKAGLIREFAPDLVPGLLQTADYYRQILASVRLPDTVDPAAAIAARLDRQAVLYDEAKQFHFVLTETAVRWRYGSAESHRIQLDRVASLATLPNVHLGVIPHGIAAPVWHSHGFVLFDALPDGAEPLVSMETLHAVLRTSEPSDVADYHDTFERLRRVALTGEAAIQLVAAIVADLR